VWNLKCKVVPVIIGATGVAAKGLKTNLEAIPGKHSIDFVEKTAILGTSPVIWQVLRAET
jgi:predicted homoserine dehydrogenase-like protein